MMSTKIHLSGGDKLMIDCSSSGYPSPVITWRRVDGKPLPERLVTHTKGLLSIRDITQSERGQYQCISSNPFGNDTRIFTVYMTGTISLEYYQYVILGYYLKTTDHYESVLRLSEIMKYFLQ